MYFIAINGSDSAYFSELLHVCIPSSTLYSSSDTYVLKIQQHKHKTHGFHTFSCFGPHIWNSLTQDLRHCSTMSSFKAKLKTFLFSQYFQNTVRRGRFLLQSLCVCVCVCVCVSTCMCLCIRISVIHGWIHCSVCVCACVCMCIHACVRACVQACVPVCMCLFFSYDTLCKLFW